MPRSGLYLPTLRPAHDAGRMQFPSLSSSLSTRQNTAARVDQEAEAAEAREVLLNLEVRGKFRPYGSICYLNSGS